LILPHPVISMEGPNENIAIQLDGFGLGQLMPMHLIVSSEGRIVSLGPTLIKALGGASPLGGAFFDSFKLRRPGGVVTMAALREIAGQRLTLVPLIGRQQLLRGVAVLLRDQAGVLINLSFGIGVIEAVAAHRLTDADFAGTDLAMELLYLVEAKTAITDELRQLNLRLQGARDAAEREALTDGLTGLTNRRGLDLALQKVIGQNRPFGLMHIDLDFFKHVNDTMGHAAGDHVLQEVGRRLGAETRQGDVVARVGGDEFVLLLERLTDPIQLGLIADRLVARLSEPILFDEQPCRISASIGISISSHYQAPSPERMLGDADRALYASKNAGRAQAQFADRVGAMLGN
jgi:diguanylate cyclase (GGDEF)-like protein